jgi:hypothetical protein
MNIKSKNQNELNIVNRTQEELWRLKLYKNMLNVEIRKQIVFLNCIRAYKLMLPPPPFFNTISLTM